MIDSSAANFFIGVRGDNVLVGTGAYEVFFAPGGTETLTGNGSHDLYIVDSTCRKIEITDFNPSHDMLAVFDSTGVNSLSVLLTDAHVTQKGLEIDFPSGAVVTLDGVTSVSALTKSDVYFLRGAFTPPTVAAPTTSLSALVGSNTPTFVTASWGSHTLTGTGATEVFFAPGGNEVLTGGGTRNIYVVDSTTAKYEIANFNPSHDVLYIGSSTGVSSLQTLLPYAQVKSGGIEIDLPHGAVILLDGLTATSSLTSTDTAFFAGAFTPPAPKPTPHSTITITAIPATLQSGQSVAVSSLFTAKDSGTNTIQDYYFYDTAHAIQLNGAANLAPTSAQGKGYVEVSTADLSKLTYLAGSAGTASLPIAATDGSGYGSARETITVTGTGGPTPTPEPHSTITVTAIPVTLQSGQSVAVSSLFTAKDSGANTIQDFYFYDATHSIHLNGATNLTSTAQQEVGYIEVSSADLSKLTYLAGSAGKVSLLIAATDGSGKASATETVTVTGTAGTPTPTPSSGPVVTATPGTVQSGHTVLLSSLVSATDSAGHAIQDYMIYDPSHGIQLNGATNLVSGNAITQSTYVEVSATDFAKLTYLGGAAGTVKLEISAYDGTSYAKGVDETITVVGINSMPPGHLH